MYGVKMMGILGSTDVGRRMLRMELSGKRKREGLKGGLWKR